MLTIKKKSFCVLSITNCIYSLIVSMNFTLNRYYSIIYRKGGADKFTCMDLFKKKKIKAWRK